MDKPKPFPKTSGYQVNWRDRLAGGLANWVMTTFATTAYLNFVYLLTKLGWDELDRRLKEGRDLDD